MPIQNIESPESLQSLCVDVISASLMDDEAIKRWSFSSYREEDFDPESLLFLTPFDTIRK